MIAAVIAPLLGISTAVAATGTPTLTIHEVDGSIVASGKHFPGSSTVDIEATLNDLDGTGTAKSTRMGRFMVEIEVEAAAGDVLEVTATSGTVEESATFTIGSSPGSTTDAPVAEPSPEPAPEETAPPPPPETAEPAGWPVSDAPGVNLGNRENVEFSAAGLTSQYHLYSDGINGAPTGLLIWLAGDGYTEYDLQGDRWPVTGEGNVAEVANSKGYAVALVLTPDRATDTWWIDGDANAAYITEFAKAMLNEMQVNRVWFTGFSGGSALISEHLVPRHAHELPIAGTFIGGGGDAPLSEIQGKINFPMFWITGDADDANQGNNYDAIGAARNAVDAYTAAGVNATLISPPGVNHSTTMELMPGELSRIL